MYLLTTLLISCRSLSVISVFLGFNIWPITLQQQQQQQQMQLGNTVHAFINMFFWLWLSLYFHNTDA
jgi:hypothetical protein